MADAAGMIIARLDAPSSYVDRSSERGGIDEGEQLTRTSTLYIGNLSFFTTEEQIWEFFSLCGEVQRVIMGLDRFEKTPCGFAFVEYARRQDALDALKYLSGTKLDDRPIKIDLDVGFIPGREYGRGKSGGQIRDEDRLEYDAARGGFGRAHQHQPVESLDAEV